MKLQTPYYLIDEKKLVKNLKKIAYVRNTCGAKSVLALKCFSAWAVFDLMSNYMDGTTSSSYFEARLGYEKFGKEVHAYCVAYSKKEVKEVSTFADKIIFNSLSQLKRFLPYVNACQVGLRLNPQVSYSEYDLADPNRKYSRLGTIGTGGVSKILSRINGLMFHFNCENDDFASLSLHIDHISKKYAHILRRVQWVSLGGGIYFTKDGYPIEAFCKKLKQLRDRFGIQVYLEPGESAITQSAQLVTSILDIVRNKINIAIVDASTEAHMLDLLVYRTDAKIKTAPKAKFTYMIAGRSCLAADIFGTFRFTKPLRIGQTIKFCDAAGYTMVKKNWFNGLTMPSVAVKRLNGKIDVVRKFTYQDFLSDLS